MGSRGLVAVRSLYGSLLSLAPHIPILSFFHPKAITSPNLLGQRRGSWAHRLDILQL